MSILSILLRRIPLQYKIIIAAAIVSAMGAAFWAHGFIKYREGKADCESAAAKSALYTIKDSLQLREEIEDANRLFTVDDLILGHSSNGWLRDENTSH